MPVCFDLRLNLNVNFLPETQESVSSGLERVMNFERDTSKEKPCSHGTLLPCGKGWATANQAAPQGTGATTGRKVHDTL